MIELMSRAQHEGAEPFYMKSKQDDSECLFQLHAIYTAHKWRMKHDTFFLPALYSSLPKLCSYKYLYPWWWGNHNYF